MNNSTTHPFFSMLLILALAGTSTASLGQQQENTQVCNRLVDATTPAGRYDFSAGVGVARDQRFNLMWQRCPLGYGLEDGGTPDFVEDDRCLLESTSEFFWTDALLAAEAHNNAGGEGGFNDWRVPNAHELATIVERQCHHPALNLRVFPNTGDFTLLGRFWSSTPELEQGFQFVGPRGRGWDFRFGRTFRSPIDPAGPFGTEALAVRLVRDP